MEDLNVKNKWINVLEDNIDECIYILYWGENFRSIKLKEEITEGETEIEKIVTYKIKKEITMKNTFAIYVKKSLVAVWKIPTKQ